MAAKKAAKKKARKTRKPKVWTAEEILADWKKAVRRGLGKKKNLAPIIESTFGPPLLAKIQTRLDEGRDYNKEGGATRAVAAFVGLVSRLLTPGDEVALGVFEKVFKLAQIHPKCPGGGGSGQWCDI